MSDRTGRERRADASPITSKPANPRSGGFSQDPTFDPDERFPVFAREDDVVRIAEAMNHFIREGGTEDLAHAVAVFVRSARTRGDPVEQVLATLESIADARDGRPPPGFAERDSSLRRAILRGVLLAFYGIDTVDRESAARARRVGHGDDATESR